MIWSLSSSKNHGLKVNTYHKLLRMVTSTFLVDIFGMLDLQLALIICLDTSEV